MNEKPWIPRAVQCPVETVLEFKGYYFIPFICKGIIQKCWVDTYGKELQAPWRKFHIYVPSERDFVPDKKTWDSITHWRRP